MRPKKQLQCIKCGASSFSLDISEFPSSLYVYDACPCYWSFLKCHLNYQDTHWSCSQFIRGGIPPWTTFLFMPHSRDSELGPSSIIHSSSDYLGTWLRPKAQYIIWPLNPTVIKSKKNILKNYSPWTLSRKDFFTKKHVFLCFISIFNPL